MFWKVVQNNGIMGYTLQALTDPQRKKSTGRSIKAIFQFFVTLITRKNVKIGPLQGFEYMAFLCF